ncbi:MAG: glycosyl hydrolase [bacterium]|nr:glycosyl hydrolase [bacterium]
MTFFESIKNLDLKVIFRTMHEMNGGWYPWSSNPEAFQEAWRHIWRLSRAVGLDQSHILFDFSVNAWDLPAKDRNPSQTTVYEHCYPKVKDKLGCPSFEDYYPGDAYVDLV